MKAPLATIAAELHVTVSGLRRLVDAAWASGDGSVAFERVEGRVLYPVDAVRAVVRRKALAPLAHVEVDESARDAMKHGVELASARATREAQRERRKREGQAAKLNRRKRKKGEPSPAGGA